MRTKHILKAKKAIRAITGNISFGEMLFSYRKAQEISQVEMAKKLNISKQGLCNIEKGRKHVSVERAVSFAHSLGMPPRTFAKYALQDQLEKAGLEGGVLIDEVA